MTQTRFHRAAWWFPLLLVSVLFAAYWPGRNGGFVLDDVRLLQRNPSLLAVDGFDLRAIASASLSAPEQSSIARPFSMLTFALNQASTGSNPVPMKVTNVLLHALNALLAWWLASRLFAKATAASVDPTRRVWAPRFVTATWALHPLQSTAVLYVVQRMELLAHTFVFAGLLLYLVGRERQMAGRRGGTWQIAAALVLATAIGILAKESAALLPLYALCIEACLLGFRTQKGISGALANSWAAVVIAGAVATFTWLMPRTLPVYAARDFTLPERLLTEARVIVEYLHWSLLPLPSSLGLFHDDVAISRGWWSPPSTTFAVLGIAALATIAVALRKHRPLTSLGLLWFLSAHLLTGTVVPLELIFEHRNYFSLFGICIVLADLFLVAPAAATTRRVCAVAAFSVVIAFALATTLRSLEWRSPEAFAAAEAAKRPGSPRAQLEYARTLVQTTAYQADSAHLPAAWAALDRARDTPGSGVLPHQVALILAARTNTLGTRDGWWDDMAYRLRVQRLNATNIAAVVALGDCAADALCRFPPERMIAVYGAALSHGPEATILASYGKYALHVLGDEALAMQTWDDAVQLSPRDAQLRYNLARLYLRLGDLEQAKAERDIIFRMGPIANHSLVADLDTYLQHARQ